MRKKVLKEKLKDSFASFRSKQRLAILLALCLYSFVMHATVLESQVSLSLKNTTLKEAFAAIKEQSGVSIVYSNRVINENARVTIDSNDLSLEQTLTVLLKNQNCSFKVENDQVILIPVKRQAKEMAQQEHVTARGVVKDPFGETIIGASVVIKGTTLGTVTDFDGNFELPNVPVGAQLEISYVGYTTRQVAVTGSNPLNIILEESSIGLEQVVVVGFGIQKKANLTGSVASVDSKVLQNRPIQNISSGLQGLMPGVTVTGTNGAPGMDAGSIRVRGVGTLNSAGPYILVDGVETGTLSAVDPNDIESISVLKDAASAAIYGSKAANGVILITTKRGTTGKTRVSYSGYVSFQNMTNLIDRMDSYEYGTLLNQALEAEGMAKRFTDEELQKFKAGNDPLYPNTDWYDLAFQTGIQHRHNVNINGGAENVNYMASLGYLNQTGVLPNASREQFNARTNLDMKLHEKLKARLNLSFIKNDYADPSSAYAGGSSDQILRQLNLIAPWIVARHDDGTYGTIGDGNPIAWLDSGMTVNRDNQNFSGIAALDYTIFDGLVLTLQGAYVSNLQNYNYFQKYIKYNANKETEPNKLDERFYKWDRTNYDVLLNYDKSFGLHNVKGLAGWHTEKYNYKYQKAERSKFPNNEVTDINAGDASTQKNEGYTAELAMLSWFGRINYDYAGKYLFEANIRSDASSRFAEGHRWGYFPSFSGAWRMTEEEFMHSLRDSWLTNMKIRASWGQLGNQDALSGTENDYYPALNVYNLGASYPFGGGLSTGYYQKKYRLETITWEKATTWGVGLDFTLFNNLNVTVDYYNRKTTGIIQDVTVPREFALDAYKDNIGSVRNTGLELTIDYRTRLGEVDFGFGGNLAYNKNEILDLGEGDPDKYLKISDADEYRNKVGKPMNSYYLYKSDGFFNSQQEADDFTAKYGNPFGKKFKAGDIRYVDTDGDGKLTADDRYYAGSTNPKFTYGFNLSAGWKNFDLLMTFNGAAGVNRLFDQHEVEGNFSGDAAHPATIWRDAWTETNHNAKMPRVFYATNSPSSYRSVKSDFWMHDVSYLRMKNLQLGYTIPRNILSSFGVESVRIYYSAENLLTFDKMDINVDPEATSGRLSSYPLLKTHAFGINVAF